MRQQFVSLRSKKYNGDASQENQTDTERSLKKNLLDSQRTSSSSDVETAKSSKCNAGGMASLYSLLFRYACRSDVTQMVFGTIGASLVGASRPIFSLLMGAIVDGLASSSSSSFQQRVNLLAIGMVVLGLVGFVGSWLQYSCWRMQAEARTQRIRQICLSTFLRQEVAWIDGHKPGQLSTRLGQDISDIENGIGDRMGVLVQSVVGFVLGISVALVKGWHLTVGIILTIPLLGGTLSLVGHFTKKYTQRNVNAYASAGEIAEEALIGIRTVTCFGGQDREADRYRAHLVAAMQAGKQKGYVNGLGTGCTMLITYFCNGASLFFGAWLIVRGITNPLTGVPYTGGDIITIFWCIYFASFNAGRIPYCYAFLVTARTAAHGIFLLCNRESNIDVLSNAGIKPPNLQGRITFSGVHFQYASSNGAMVLRDITFDVEAGSTVAFVGQSGSGKSTLCSLMMRFYDPTAGSIRLDGIALRSLNVRWLRSNIGVVNQEPILFATTVKENVRLAKPDASDEQIIEACKAANAHDFISSLADGYDTYVGEGGSQLSGGQKQRVAIARAIIKNPKILILDEATSALDNESERLVQQALERLMKGRTVIMVAHRLSTIKNADCIHVLSGGCIIESGSHTELLALGGAYSHLVEAQSSNDQESEAKSDRSTHESPLTTFSEAEAPEMAVADKDGQLTAAAPSVSTWRMLGLVSNVWVWVALGVAGAAMSGSVNPAFGLMYSKMVAVFYQASSNSSLSPAAFWGGLLAALGVYAFFATILQVACIGFVGEVLAFKLRDKSFSSILRQEMAFFDDEKNNVRTLATRLEVDPRLVQAGYVLRLGTMVQTFFVIVSGSLIAMWASWELTLIAIGAVPLMIVSGVFQMRLNNRSLALARTSFEAGSRWAGMALANVRTVASLTAEQQVVTKYGSLLQAHSDAGVRHSIAIGFNTGFSMFVLYGSYGLAFWYGYRMLENGQISLQDIITVLYAVIWTGRGLSNSFGSLPDIQKGDRAAAVVMKLVDRQSSINPKDRSGDHCVFSKGAIEMKDVAFRYPSRPENLVLNRFNLTVPSGQNIALVGPSGCGKSTVTALVERLYEPESGSILIDGLDIKCINIATLRSQIAIVSQEPMLFADTVLENIRYGRRDASEEEVIEAARLCKAHDFIMRLPQQYSTYVGPRGGMLSGGQKQLVAISRAVLMKPRILLLDEATSALDTNSERIVQEALEIASKGRTTITIAQRLSTIRGAHLIAYISSGSVCELGTHEQLMRHNGHYASMVRHGCLHDEDLA